MTAAWTIEPARPEDDAWLELLQRHDHLVFHTPQWCRTLEEGFVAEPHCLLLLHQGRAVGGVCGMVLRSLWARLLHLCYPYGGILGQTPPAAELAKLLRGYARARGCARVRLVPFPGMGPEGSEGFRVTPTPTRMLDLRGADPEALLPGYKKNVRRDVRRAERNGVVVQNQAGDDAVQTFYDLYLQAMQRNRALAKYSRALVADIARRFCEHGQGALLLAFRQDRPLAGMLVVDSPRASHYLMAGSDSEGLKLLPNDLLVHTAIRRACERGLDFFDFLPSGPDDHALERFKAKWGAEQHPADTLDIVTRPLALNAWQAAGKLAGWGPLRRAYATLRGSAW